jgi:hypothetical protein
MGWFYTEGLTRAQLVHHLTEPWIGTDDKLHRVSLAHAAVGNTLYVVWEVQETGERWISVNLMRNNGSYGWGYKDMTESMGPTECSCPLKFLDMVAEPNSEYAKNWRERVRAYHARRNQPLHVGQVIPFPKGTRPPEVTITSLKPLRGEYHGVVYSIPRKMLPEPAPGLCGSCKAEAARGA